MRISDVYGLQTIRSGCNIFYVFSGVWRAVNLPEVLQIMGFPSFNIGLLFSNSCIYYNSSGGLFLILFRKLNNRGLKCVYGLQTITSQYKHK